MIQILKNIPFFSTLSDQDLQVIAEKVTMEYYPASYTLFNEGDPGDIMYIIKTGSAEVVRNNAIVATLGAGDFFGEMALVSDEPRNATLKITAEMEVLTLKKEDFRHLLETNANIASMVSYEVVKRVNEND